MQRVSKPNNQSLENDPGTNLIVSTEQHPMSSSVYIGYVILSALKSKERITIFDLYGLINAKRIAFNYKNVIHALVFLYMNNLVDFDEPFIYKI